MPPIKHIKQTISVCPRCLKDLEAEVIEEPAGIALLRICPEHGSFHNIVETDKDFYKAAANINKERFQKRINWLVLPITDKCDQRCKFCFYPTRKGKDWPLEEVLEIAAGGPASICISGGEPTLHPELPEIISRIHGMGKNVHLMTNGLSLADRDFVRKLKDAGLQYVLLSINGFDDNILMQIDQSPCLEKKLKAMDNLKEQGIRMQPSLSLLRGVNEGELKKALKLCLDNIEHVWALRVRALSQVGRSEKTAQLTMGELVSLLADALGVSRKELIDGIKGKKISSATQYNAMLYFLRLNGQFIFLASLDLYFSGLMKKKFLRECVAVLNAFHYRGIRMGCRILFNILVRRQKIIGLETNMFSWPDRYSMDLNEVNSADGAYLTSNKKMGKFVPGVMLDRAFTNVSVAKGR